MPGKDSKDEWTFKGLDCATPGPHLRSDYTLTGMRAVALQIGSSPLSILSLRFSGICEPYAEWLNHVDGPTGSKLQASSEGLFNQLL